MQTKIEKFLKHGGFLALENPVLESIDVDLLGAQLPEVTDHSLFRTSGTEGEPKFVAISRGALLASARSVNERFGAGPVELAQDMWNQWRHGTKKEEEA